MVEQDTAHMSFGRPDEQVTCDQGWTLIEPATRKLEHRYMEIMCQMNRPTYSDDSMDSVVDRMLRQKCEFYYRAAENHEMVIGFKWKKRIKRWRILSCGFVGRITPAEALEPFINKVIWFMRRKDVDRVMAIRPYQMENQSIIEFYDLIVQHPRVIVRGHHQVAEGTYWWLSQR